MSWNSTWVFHRGGRAGGWWPVALWMALLAIGVVGLASSFWDSSRPASFLVLAFGATATLWILAPTAWRSRSGRS